MACSPPFASGLYTPRYFLIAAGPGIVFIVKGFLGEEIFLLDISEQPLHPFKMVFFPPANLQHVGHAPKLLHRPLQGLPFSRRLSVSSHCARAISMTLAPSACARISLM